MRKSQFGYFHKTKDFIALALESGLELYVIEKISKNHTVNFSYSICFLLATALNFTNYEIRLREEDGLPAANPDFYLEVVNQLLIHGADSDEPFRGQTMWSLFLRLLHDKRSSKDSSDLIPWADTAILFVRQLMTRGLSPNIKFKPYPSQPTQTAIQICESKFDTEVMREITSIIRAGENPRTRIAIRLFK